MKEKKKQKSSLGKKKKSKKIGKEAFRIEVFKREGRKAVVGFSFCRFSLVARKEKYCWFLFWDWEEARVRKGDEQRAKKAKKKKKK